MSTGQHQFVCNHCRAARVVTEEEARWTVTCFVCNQPMNRADAPVAQAIQPSGAVPMARPIDAAPTAGPIAAAPVPTLDAASALPTANANEANEAPIEQEEVEPSWIADNLGMVLGMIVLVAIATGIVVLALSGFQLSTNEGSPTEVVIGPDGKVSESNTPTIVDASKASIRRLGVKVRVVRVEWERLWAKDNSNAVVRSVSPKFAVHLRVNNQIDLQRPYTRWNADSSAELSDSAGRSYALTPLSEWASVLGKTTSTTLPPGEVIDDIVVFDAPDDSIEDVQWLRLRLPCSVYGGEGDYWFEIPRSMIRKPTADAPPPNWIEQDEPNDVDPPTPS